jgi:hypothetical protein
MEIMATSRTGPLVLTCMVVVLVLGACSPVRDVDFGQFTFAPDSCASVVLAPPAGGYELVDGEVRNGSPADADFYSVTLRPGIAFGDLTGDGLEEAALILDCSNGNRPIPVGRVMTVGAIAPAPLGSVPRPPLPSGARRMELAALEIRDQRLETMWTVLEEDDSPCCPTGTLSASFRWDGTQLVLDAGGFGRADGRCCGLVTARSEPSHPVEQG